MKRVLQLLSATIFFSLLFAGCASNPSPFPSQALVSESWIRQVDTNSNRWFAGTTSWFKSANPNRIELANRHADYEDAISTMQVRVPNFTKLRINGDFQVQLYGRSDHNTVLVYGPNEGVRQVKVMMRGNVLCVEQVKDASSTVQKVIIRVGIRDLQKLYKAGCGSVEGIGIYSSRLMITAQSKGNIYLSGQMNLQCVENGGEGSVNILGAQTPYLLITTSSSGAVNIDGEVGVRSITHHGSADINIIGATSTPLAILADGSGKIGIQGHHVNPCDIKAKDQTCVYICQVGNGSVHAYATHKARIGLAGYTGELHVETTGSSRFMGRYLCARNAYVRANDASHINVSASHKIFASASRNASIYFYGSPELISQYTDTNAVVLAVYAHGVRSCMIPRRHWQLKGEG